MENPSNMFPEDAKQIFYITSIINKNNYKAFRG